MTTIKYLNDGNQPNKLLIFRKFKVKTYYEI